jgi:hypothetical protein
MKYQTWKGKMLYTPGIISLVLFIPLSLFFLEKLHVFEQFRVLEIDCHNPNTGKYVSPGDIYFTDVILSGSDKDDQAQMFLVESMVETLVKSGDTTKGVHLRFDDRSKYKLLVKALDICQRWAVRNYVVDENDLWICNLYPPREINFRSVCDTRMYLENLQVREEQRPDNTRYLAELKFWPSILIFFALVIMAIIENTRRLIRSRHSLIYSRFAKPIVPVGGEQKRNEF